MMPLQKERNPIKEGGKNTVAADVCTKRDEAAASLPLSLSCGRVRSRLHNQTDTRTRRPNPASLAG